MNEGLTKKKWLSNYASKWVVFSYAYNAVTGSFKININMYNTFPILKTKCQSIFVAICSTLVYQMYLWCIAFEFRFWTTCITHLSWMNKKNINNNAEPNVMKENPSLYLFDIVLTTYHFFHKLKKYRYTNKYHHDTHRNS